MSYEVKVPQLPESVADATVAAIHKKVGDAICEGEILFELETDKIVLEVPSSVTGSVASIEVAMDETVLSDHVLMRVSEGAAPAATEPVADSSEIEAPASPSVRRDMQTQNIVPGDVTATGDKGRITKEDVARAAVVHEPAAPAQASVPVGERMERRVPMSRLRARVAERLLEVQQNAAILTTFNEVNMQPVMDVRAKYRDEFEKKHGVRLGFMSFFLKAAVEALKAFPNVNASIENQDVIYHEYFDVGVAVSTERGLVVPILRDVDQMSMADIERSIGDYAKKARDGKLTLEDLSGGTFSVTNGGVFGSMLSTPILNPPQSAILGMHNIVKRPVVEGDAVVVRPIMYLALSYDHRIIDGRESVQFLVTLKQMLEDPARLLLNV